MEMYSNIEYSKLLAKYNRVVSENISLRDQLQQNNRRMAEREARIKHDNDMIRSICEEILSKDNNEMVVGEEYSWDRMSVSELIERTILSYRKHNRERTELILKLVDLTDERADQIDSLTEQIEQLEHMYDSKGKPDNIPASSVSDPENEKKTEDESAKCGDRITIGPEDCINDMLDAVVDAMKITESVHIKPPPIPISEPREKIERIKSEKKKVKESMKIDVTPIKVHIDKMNPIMKEIVLVMGEIGLSVYMEIRDEVLKRCGDTMPGISEQRIRAGITQLESMNIVQKNTFCSPLRGNLNIARLTVTGMTVFKELTGKLPVISEMERIVKEHDNIEHGYGIRELADILENSGKYSSVTWMNGRKPIQLKDGQSIIPDITAKTAGRIEYFEYERANHSFPDLKVKLNKLASITKYINIVVQNTDQLNAMLRSVEKWAKERDSSVPHKCLVRLSTIKYYSQHEPGTDMAWMYELNTETGELVSVSGSTS